MATTSLPWTGAGQHGGGQSLLHRVHPLEQLRHGAAAGGSEVLSALRYVLSRLGMADGILNAFHQFFREAPGYLSSLRRIQYDTLYGHRYLTGGEAAYVPADMKMGILPIEVHQLYSRAESGTSPGKISLPIAGCMGG